jgi:hypothetical protein
MDFPLILHWFWAGRRSHHVFSYRPGSHTHRAKPVDFMALTIISRVLAFQENTNCNDVPLICRYQFWNGFIMSFEIGIGSILGPFSSNCPYLLVLMCQWFVGRICNGFWTEKVPESKCHRLPPAPFIQLVRPETLTKRIWRTTLIFHRFGIDVGTHAGHMFVISAWFVQDFMRQHRQFLPASRIEPFCFKMTSK